MALLSLAGSASGERTAAIKGDTGASDAGRPEPRVPRLRSITAPEAEAQGVQVRRLQVSVASGGGQPVAWSLVNLQCSARTPAIN